MLDVQELTWMQPVLTFRVILYFRVGLYFYVVAFWLGPGYVHGWQRSNVLLAGSSEVLQY